MLAAVVFDVDGVLVDSHAAHLASWRALAAEAGRSVSTAQFRASFGRTSREFIRELWGADAPNPAEVAALEARKEAHYRRIAAETLPPMDGAVELIDALRAA
ncbi:MAG TPA: HAD family hydrolase, partial [Candidatus Polarisedimenticolaceae bacterium]|nr:HAD family hydrolase [Candidatus Polarisedimenticolaceae bacterium]